jgi:hypothetical protein
VDLPERTPDGHAQVWLLYQPEPWAPDAVTEQEINLWVRRCTIHSTQALAVAYLDNLLGQQITWRPYNALFPELWIAFDSRGYRWLMQPAALDPLVGYADA